MHHNARRQNALYRWHGRMLIRFDIMANALACLVLFVVSLCLLVVGSMPLQEDSISTKILEVGMELVGEILPLKLGQRLYQLHGLKASTWYEVKISYPASIPASFSIQLRRDVSDIPLGNNRRLLNTEKLIFKADMDKLGAEAYVLVTVEAAGIVAKPHTLERETVLFNIVCDELSLGIPHKAWCVGIVALFCLVLAVIAPYYLHSGFLTKNQTDEPREIAALKAS